MKLFQLSKYRDIFQSRSFRYFWVGFTVSNFGDAMTRVVLNWYVWETTQSPTALGLLAFFYTGPVVIGGLLAGSILDRYDRRKVILVDSLFRGIAVAAIPLLNLLGVLEVWHAYMVAAIYGFLIMIPAAGGPSLVPSLVQKEHLATANALEVFGFTFSNVGGPALAGALIGWLGAPNVIVVDSLSYFLFALALTQVTIPKEDPEINADGQPRARYRLRDAANLLVKNRILLATTSMFLIFNVGYGVVMVWLPIYADTVLGGGAGLYGLLLGVMALGEVTSSFIAGGIALTVSLGMLIGIFQFLAGASVLGILFATEPVLAGVVLFITGFFHAPLTVWAQTLRMRIIPEGLRGRTFALLRMLMIGGLPLGGVIGGSLVAASGVLPAVLFSALVSGLPGAAGLLVRELRESQRLFASSVG